jgi:hypothetical protein
MARPCAACKHDEREAIDAALVTGASCGDVSRRFGLSEDSLQRHREKHIPQVLTKAQEAAEVAHADNLLDQLKALQSKALELLAAAEKQGDYKAAISGIGQARGCIELMAKLQGQISDGTTINVIVNPQWLEVRAVIIEALADHPAARLDVANALQALEGAHAG